MMDDFKLIIEAYIEDSVDIENVAWLLEISDRFGAYKLKVNSLKKVFLISIFTASMYGIDMRDE